MDDQLIICIVGPTASGKTDLAIEIARRHNAEIISADSMQVYRGMDILSAKPGTAQRTLVPHHLIDILEPHEEYNAALFVRLGRRSIADITRRGKTPLVVGGSGLYLHALVHGLFEEQPKDVSVRKRLEEQADTQGGEALFEELRRVDPDTAAIIDRHNVRRLIRALEAYYVNNIPLSVLKQQSRGIAAEYDVKMFGIHRERQELYERIDRRVEEMFAQGVVEEVKKLVSLPLSKTALQALGIKQIQGYLKGAYSLSEAKDMLKRDTRRYAKRQLTWFRKEKDLYWIKADKSDLAGLIFRRKSPGLISGMST